MTLNPELHKSILIRILKDIFTDSRLGPLLGFKGGTAALLFYGLPRFSVDLDFDLLDEKSTEIVFEHIKHILEQYGTVKKAEHKRYTLFFLLSYNEKIDNAQNIKIEINKRVFGSKYEVKHYLGIAMQVMVKEDIVANKLVAMIERIGKTNRDIFDVWFFLNNNWPINQEIIQVRTQMSYKEFVEKCINTLEHMNNRGILGGIGELLDPKQKNWVKSNLKNETIFLLKLILSNLI